MLNQDEFIKRLYKIFEHYNLTAAVFADEIKVQRSSISHLLSGRNKPSLEFVLKITSQYKLVDLDWLLYGKGDFPKREKAPIVNSLFNSPPPTSTKKNTATYSKDGLLNDIEQKKTTPSEIERIVVFYKNGTFKEYSQNND